MQQSFDTTTVTHQNHCDWIGSTPHEPKTSMNSHQICRSRGIKLGYKQNNTRNCNTSIQIC
ncbi:hypothetical protein Hanom_Chr14g01314861 [Helianthus anomalus]